MLITEYFSRLMLSLNNDVQFQYHVKCKSLKVTHLSFVDDLMLFCKGDGISALRMKALFDQFLIVSGLKANLSKSCIFFSVVTKEVHNTLIAHLRMTVGKLLVRYLGVPFISTSLSKVDCQPLVAKVGSKLCSRTAKFLSYSGRCQLLKAIVLQLQLY